APASAPVGRQRSRAAADRWSRSVRRQKAARQSRQEQGQALVLVLVLVLVQVLVQVLALVLVLSSAGQPQCPKLASGPGQRPERPRQLPHQQQPPHGYLPVYRQSYLPALRCQAHFPAKLQGLAPCCPSCPCRPGSP